jgi:hypothetical protein
MADFWVWLDFWKFATIVLASFAAWTGVQQFRLSREKFKLDLFEKRFAVFAGARTFLTHILRDGDLKTLELLWEYRAAIGEASFLFDDKVTDYLEEIYEYGLKLHTDGETMRPLAVGNERNRLASERNKSLKWLTDQLPELKIRFAPFMKFQTWK